MKIRFQHSSKTLLTGLFQLNTNTSKKYFKHINKRLLSSIITLKSKNRTVTTWQLHNIGQKIQNGECHQLRDYILRMSLFKNKIL